MLQAVVQCVVVLALPLCLISATLWLLGNRLLGAIYGPEYSTSGSIAFLLSLSTITVTVSIACGNGLAALKRPRAYFWGEFGYFLASVSVAWLLIPHYGLAGAAWGLIIGGVVASVVTSLTLYWVVNVKSMRAFDVS